MQQGNNKISLLISGNQFRSAGFQPIIATGQYMLQLTYQSYPGMDSTPYYYVLRITPDYTQYTLVHNKVTSADGVSGTMLKMSVAIPAGTRLQNGVSVLTLLDEIREAFTTLFMVPTLGVEGDLTYKRDLPSKAVFEEILSRYPLEPIHTYQCVSEGSRPGILVASRDTIELLFQDAQCPEFKHYSEVIIANEADCSFYEGCVINELNNGRGIPIPPIRTYRLIINGKDRKWPVADPLNERTVISSTKLFGLSSNEYEEERTSFTINELLNGNGPSNVSIDMENRVVSCTINHPNRIVRRKPVKKPTEMSLSMKIRNCPIEESSFPATLDIQGNSIPAQQYPVEFVRRNGYFICGTPIDSQLANQNVTISVLTDGIIDMTTPVTRLLNEGANDITVEFDRYFQKPANFAATINRNKKSILGVGLATIALLLAGIIFLAVRGKDGKEVINSNDKKEGGPITENPIKKEEHKSLADFIKESEKNLAEDDLTFAVVDDIYNKYQEYQKDEKEIEKLGNTAKEFGDKIGIYHDLVDAINKRAKNDEKTNPITQLRKISGNDSEIGSFKELNELYNNYIHDSHKKYVDMLYHGGKIVNSEGKTVDFYWTTKSKDQNFNTAKGFYVNPSFTIDSFDDFKAIVDSVYTKTNEKTERASSGIVGSGSSGATGSTGKSKSSGGTGRARGTGRTSGSGESSSTSGTGGWVHR